MGRWCVPLKSLYTFQMKYNKNSAHYMKTHPEQLSRYSDWLRDGRPRGRSSRPGKVKNFLFSTSSRPALRPTQPPIQWVRGALSSGLKRTRREADHSPPASVEVKEMWIYTSTPPYVFMALNFTYTETYINLSVYSDCTLLNIYWNRNYFVQSCKEK
jgi:hypothetical protein